MYCEGCGKEISTEGNPRFCSQCGIQQLRGGKVATGKTSSSSAPQWMKGCLVAFGIMALLATLFVANAIHLSNKKTKKEAQIKANMVEYLNKKYKKEFVVDKLTKEERRVWSWYEATAYLKENREIAFLVKSNSENENLFSDTYSTGLWSYQGKQDLIKVLDSIYGSNYRLVSYTYMHNYNEYINNDYIQEINRCKEMYGKGCVGIDITYIVILNNELDKYKESEKVLKLINSHIPYKKLNSYSIDVAYMYKNKFNYGFIETYRYKKRSDLLDNNSVVDYLIYHNISRNGAELKEATTENIVKSFNSPLKNG